jgi:hypothetical protein
MRKALFPLLLLAGYMATAQQKLLVYFEPGKHLLDTKAKETINQLFNSIDLDDLQLVTIIGYTDSDGSDGFNMALSKKRAAAVLQYLKDNGIAKQKLSMSFLGEKDSLASNANAQEKQLNRRVELQIRLQDHQADNIPLWQQPRSSKESQQFTINPTKPGMIKGKQGTVLQFSTNAFVDKDGNKVTGDVSVDMVEVYAKSQMLVNGMQTTCNDSLLESAGMVHISASANGTQVYLGKNGYFQLELPTKNIREDMQFFYADSGGQRMNWKPVDSSNSRVNFNCNICDGRCRWLSDGQNANAYIFLGTKLGWINCDRFVPIAKKTNLYVGSADTAGVGYFLVFKSLNAVMAATVGQNGPMFADIPQGRTATIVAFRKKGKDRYYSSRTISIGKDQKEMLVLEKMDEAKFLERMKEFN